MNELKIALSHDLKPLFTARNWNVIPKCAIVFLHRKIVHITSQAARPTDSEALFYNNCTLRTIKLVWKKEFAFKESSFVFFVEFYPIQFYSCNFNPSYYWKFKVSWICISRGNSITKLNFFLLKKCLYKSSINQKWSCYRNEKMFEIKIDFKIFRRQIIGII